MNIDDYFFNEAKLQLTVDSYKFFRALYGSYDDAYVDLLGQTHEEIEAKFPGFFASMDLLRARYQREAANIARLTKPT